MQDIKIPVTNFPKKASFDVTHIAQGEAVSHEQGERKIGDHVKVKFEKFVQLVATHDFEEVLKAHSNDDIVVNSNLLADLASAHTEEDESLVKKMPVMLIIGFAVGIALTYLILSYK